MKCANGHETSTKFCGECGSSAQEEPKSAATGDNGSSNSGSTSSDGTPASGGSTPPAGEGTPKPREPVQPPAGAVAEPKKETKPKHRARSVKVIAKKKPAKKAAPKKKEESTPLARKVKKVTKKGAKPVINAKVKTNVDKKHAKENDPQRNSAWAWVRKAGWR